jgi:hypothetical protein
MLLAYSGGREEMAISIAMAIDAIPSNESSKTFILRWLPIIGSLDALE